MPQISVIVPVYNVEKYINRCVDSILAQTFRDFELILVDDGSSDKSGKICDEYARNGENITVIHQKNGGRSVARNTGIRWVREQSSSRWIAFVDSDDWIHPQYLERLYFAAVETGASIVSCRLCRTAMKSPFQNLENIKWNVVESEKDYTHCFRGIFAYFPTRLFQVQCFDNILFPIGRNWEDLSVCWKILIKYKTVTTLPDVLYFYFINEDGIVRSKWTEARWDEIIAYEEHIDELEKKYDKWRSVLPCLKSEYVRAISSGYYKLMTEGSKNDILDNKNKYQNKARRALKMYRKECNITVLDYPTIYEAAFPKTMRLYWYWKKIEKMIRRKNA